MNPGRPITFTRTLANGEVIEIDDGYEYPDPHDEDYAYNEEDE